MLRSIASNLESEASNACNDASLADEGVLESGSKTGCYIFFHHSNRKMGVVFKTTQSSRNLLLLGRTRGGWTSGSVD